jgi:hypothetical protein
MAIIEQRPDVETLAAAIAHSQIVVVRTPGCASPQQAASRRHLPDGFEDVDLAILDWIAEEGRRVGRSLIKI